MKLIRIELDLLTDHTIKQLLQYLQDQEIKYKMIELEEL